MDDDDFVELDDFNADVVMGEMDHPHICDDCGAAWSHIDSECMMGLIYSCPDCIESPTDRSV